MTWAPPPPLLAACRALRSPTFLSLTKHSNASRRVKYLLV
eukprot:CAMPEP_0118805070 /NCGR_PEP_ID=MMETSP1161-20130426/25915_1 /TAXON_ID=249345 /ORGANISM="Picochlorum oklahomensis, Strain CCMP2329" /LENGTH=39 /DNA_ID= /DNA_START= /DNA_END= /DNA_ORIENTATION=